MRGFCSCARALVLAAALVVMSSSSGVADGVKTTPSWSSGGSGDSARIDGGTNNGYKPADQATTTVLHDRSKPAVLAMRQRSASGSRLPDCAHACGACSPCRRVMVSFMCAESASESCPIAYRCMCRGRFFRVPSL
ncbi:hypothetical protein QOZ80_4AG0315190 [Eleusine coracana subsp. coracana]|nr:hypothetical protein QOZ80_4AG0315190 [Eleusine coracana subsp. coracana]